MHLYKIIPYLKTLIVEGFFYRFLKHFQDILEKAGQKVILKSKGKRHKKHVFQIGDGLIQYISILFFNKV